MLGHGVLTVLRDNKELTVTVPGTILNDLSDYGIGEFVKPRVKFAVDSINPNSNAQKAHLAKGDSIIAVNGNKITFFDEMQSQLLANKNKQVQLTVKHNNVVEQLPTKVNADGTLGFYAKYDAPKNKTSSLVSSLRCPLGHLGRGVHLLISLKP